MTPRSHARPTDEARARSRARLWQIGTPVVVLLSGALFAVSAVNSDGTDLRPGRYTGMASLVQTERDRVDDLEERVRTLQDEVARLTDATPDRAVRRIQGRVERLQDPAGLTPRRGEGVRVVLSDAPSEVIDRYSGDPNDLLVHQQDIQAVVNALWNGGAEAVTIEGQRVITTTGIKCSGSTVQLHGVPYPAPYEIEAVGDPRLLAAALDNDPYVSGYRRLATDPDEGLGWQLSTSEQVVAPAYDGLLGLRYAEPITDAAGD